MSARAAALALCVALPGLAGGAEPVLPGGRYVIASRMVLPHLEEMRRIVEEERACLSGGRVAALFPVFRQPAMTGCTLVPAPADAPAGAYALACEGNNGATGSARVSREGARVTAVLRAKMGGKNMTFSQHVVAVRESDC